MLDQIFSIRLNIHDQNHLLKKAYELGFVTKENNIPKLGAFIRHAALNSDYKIHHLKGIDEFTMACLDIRKTGVLLNQLMRKIHERNLSEEELELEKTFIDHSEVKDALTILEDLANNQKVVFNLIEDFFKKLNELEKEHNVLL